MKIVILKYNAGNTQSVKFALNRLGIDPLISNNREDILNCDKLIIPGVGEAGNAMKYLKQYRLEKVIGELKQPVLGICLGMQLMCNYSEEGGTNCLGIFNAKVARFNSSLETEHQSLMDPKIPQIGWNSLNNLRSPLFRHINEGEFQYFVHGYYIENNENTIATTNYINEYSSAIQKNNFYGVQFHPEKSSKAGEQILKNFIDL
jgi:imidazole glycerol-phosphate synthase subunit HisH